MNMGFVRPVGAFLAIFAVSAWLFYTRAIVPLNLRREGFLHRREQLADDLAAARAKFVAVKQAELKVAVARGALNEFLGTDREESVMVAFPSEVREHFSRYG